MLGNKLELNMSFIDGVLYIEEHDPAPDKSVYDHIIARTKKMLTFRRSLHTAAAYIG
jgi:hypothetical protein